MVRTTRCPVYWIEDELDLFQRTVRRLETERCSVLAIKTASSALRSLELLRRDRGPIILDLWLPDETDPCIPTGLQGPALGLWLLEELRSELGPNQVFLIVSGNLSVDVLDELRNRGIADQDIFAKPLHDRADEFVRLVVESLSTPADA